jgi:hypothetical protein
LVSSVGIFRSVDLYAEQYSLQRIPFSTHYGDLAQRPGIPIHSKREKTLKVDMISTKPFRMRFERTFGAVASC